MGIRWKLGPLAVILIASATSNAQGFDDVKMAVITGIAAVKDVIDNGAGMKDKGQTSIGMGPLQFSHSRDMGIGNGDALKSQSFSNEDNDRRRRKRSPCGGGRGGRQNTTTTVAPAGGGRKKRALDIESVQRFKRAPCGRRNGQATTTTTVAPPAGGGRKKRSLDVQGISRIKRSPFNKVWRQSLKNEIGSANEELFRKKRSPCNTESTTVNPTTGGGKKKRSLEIANFFQFKRQNEENTRKPSAYIIRQKRSPQDDRGPPRGPPPGCGPPPGGRGRGPPPDGSPPDQEDIGSSTESIRKKRFSQNDHGPPRGPPPGVRGRGPPPDQSITASSTESSNAESIRKRRSLSLGVNHSITSGRNKGQPNKGVSELLGVPEVSLSVGGFGAPGGLGGRSNSNRAAGGIFGVGSPVHLSDGTGSKISTDVGGSIGKRESIPGRIVGIINRTEHPQRTKRQAGSDPFEDNVIPFDQSQAQSKNVTDRFKELWGKVTESFNQAMQSISQTFTQVTNGAG